MNRKIIARVLCMVIVGFIAIMICALCAGCGNKQMFDTTCTYNYAIVQLPNGEIIEGKVDSWTDFEDGDQIQVKIDGKSYLVHSENIVLIDE